MRQAAFRAWTDLMSGVIGLVSPRSAIEYRASRSALERVWQRSYAAGKTSGPNQLWSPTNKDADSEISRDALRITARARDLVRNDPNVAGAIKKVVANVVGDGRYPQSRVMSGDNLNETFNTAAELLFEQWETECDRTGHDDFPGMSALVLEHLLIDGEALIHVSVDNSAPVHPLRLTVIEADQLDSQKSEALSNGSAIRRGVEINSAGKPVAYWIFPTHPGDPLAVSTQSIRYPAEQIIHLFERSRASQTRGISWLAPVIMRMYDIGEYQDYEIQGAKLAAAFGLFVTSPDIPGLGYGSGGTEQKAGDNKTPLEYFEPGMVKYLRPGEKVEIASHNRPNAAYGDFVRANLRSASAGMGVSYETFSNDYTSSTYSSTRASLLEERRVYRMIHRFLERHLYSRLYKEFIRLAVIRGLLRAPGYEKDPTPWNRVTFTAPAWEWVDPVKDIEAARLEVELGINTLSDLCSAKGRDFNDIVRQRAKENAVLAAAGLPLPGSKPEPTPAPIAAPPEPESGTKPDEKEVLQ